MEFLELGKVGFRAMGWMAGDEECPRVWLRKWRSLRRGLLDRGGGSWPDFVWEREPLELPVWGKNFLLEGTGAWKGGRRLEEGGLEDGALVHCCGVDRPRRAPLADMGGDLAGALAGGRCKRGRGADASCLGRTLASTAAVACQSVAGRVRIEQRQGATRRGSDEEHVPRGGR